MVKLLIFNSVFREQETTIKGFCFSLRLDLFNYMDESFIRENSFYTYTKTMQTYIELFSFRNIKKHLFICLKTYFKILKIFTFRK